MKRIALSLSAVSLLIPCLPAQPARAQQPPTNEAQAARELAEFVKANYTKYEYRVPMRDGKKLFTSVYVPKDFSEKWPIMLNRTPYSVGPYGVNNYKTSLGPSDKFTRDKDIFVYQDVRGRYLSEGVFVDVRPHIAFKKSPNDVDESSDTYDTIDWLLKNIPNNNGKVGISGISYPGFYASAGCVDAHPALKACSPQAPVTDWWTGDDFHHNGTLYLPHAFNFFNSFGRPRPILSGRTKYSSPCNRTAPTLISSSLTWAPSRTSTRKSTRTRSRSGTT